MVKENEKVLIIVPTYNEKENIVLLIPEIKKVLPDAHILVVDDSSPDGTADRVREMQSKWSDSLFLIIRDVKDGLAGAYLRGFTYCLNKKYDIIIEMDADGSHDPSHLPAMILESKNYDYVLGSRYVQGGGVENWNFIRKFISKGGSLYSRILLGSSIKDLTGGFNLWRSETLLGIGPEKIISRGYLFQVELKIRAYKLGFKYKEIPIIFKDREFGVSKMSSRIFVEALFKIWKLKIKLR